MGGFPEEWPPAPAVTRACLGSNGGWRPRPNSGGYVSIPGREAFGSGREMLAFAEDVARQDGWARMALSACELEQGAISLYRKFGVSVHKSFAGSDPSAHSAVGFDGFSLKRIYDEASAAGLLRCSMMALIHGHPVEQPRREIVVAAVVIGGALHLKKWLGA